MRIDRLDLIAYGPFTRTSLDMSDGDAGLHVIYGDNEAGKTTTLRALIGLLFGIEARTRDNHLHANPQLRIGGRLTLATGETLEFIRRKGNKNTLLDCKTETVLDDAVLAPFVPRDIDEAIFTRLYGIDHQRLLQGGEELLNQSGDLGQALFSAALGDAGPREVLTGLRKSADELYTPRASSRPVNMAIKGYREAQKQVRQASLSVSTWKGLHKEMVDTVAAIGQVEQEIASKGKEKSRLERLNRVRGALAERRGLKARLAELASATLLPKDFDDRRRAALDRLQKAGEAENRAEARLSRLHEEAATLNVRHDLLEHERTILEIHRQLGSVEKTIHDRPQQDGKRRQLRNEAETLLKGVRPDLGLDAADQLRPLLNNKGWISGLARNHALLNQNKNNAEAALRDVEDELADIKRELGQLPPGKIDLGDLKTALAKARKAGDLEERLSVMERRAAEEQAACEAELARLGRFSGTVEALLAAAMPVPETLDAFDKKFEALSQKGRDCDRRQKELLAEQKQAEQDLRTLLLQGEVPTLSELEMSRNDRNTGWNLIKRSYIQRQDVAREITEYAADSDLPTLYEQKVETADHLADQIRLAADQVLKRADLEVKIEHLTWHLNDLAGETAGVRTADKTCREEWKAVWRPLGITPGTPPEMKQWLLRVERLFANVRSAQATAHETLRLADQQKMLKEAMSVEIGKFDAAMDPAGMDLDTMIHVCEERVEREETTLQRRQQLEHSLGKAETRLKRTRDELDSIDRNQAEWRREWEQAITGLGLGADAHPERGLETFERLNDFFDRFDRSEELRRRIYGMDKEVEEFAARVFALTESLGLERQGQEAGAIAAELHRDLNEAREARAGLKKIRDQEKETREELETARIDGQTAQDELARLRRFAGVHKDEELEPAAAGSKNKRELQGKIETLEQELARSGDGLGIAELEKEAQNSDMDALEGELTTVRGQLEELNRKRDTLRDQRQRLQSELDIRDGSSAAANASQEAAEHLADAVSGLEQHLRLQIAALILEERIEEYRKKNQAPLLTRAGELFRELTLGSYANLRDELDEKGNPILLGVRPNGREVTIDGMSDGTRDQLYLALRLATLEQHLRNGEPMPFVVDDILIGFDDRRTRVCLKVLAELAALTQVLLFTHHHRVVELTGGLKSAAGIFIHELA